MRKNKIIKKGGINMDDIDMFMQTLDIERMIELINY